MGEVVKEKAGRDQVIVGDKGGTLLGKVKERVTS